MFTGRGSANNTSTDGKEVLGTADLERAPAFSLGTALAWLGHDCCGDCPALVTDCRSMVWFARLAGTRRPTSIRTLVEVDFTDPAWAPAAVGGLLRKVNDCVRPNHIRVRELVTSRVPQRVGVQGETSP